MTKQDTRGSQDRGHWQIRKRLACAIMRRSDGLLDSMYGARKSELFRNLPAEIVEIGPGGGINFRYYPRGTKVHAIEPNPFFHPLLQEKAKKYQLELSIHDLGVEQMPVAEDSVSTVVGTLVLCSVADLETAIKRIWDCLKTGGDFRFVEHVVSPNSKTKRFCQGLLSPIWTFACDGCHLNRDTAEHIRGRFDSANIESFTLGNRLLPFSPHIIGIATKT
jgi:SAM-dependent methyltransferase